VALGKALTKSLGFSRWSWV